MSTSTLVEQPSRRQRKPRSDLKLGLAFILPATIGLVAFYIWPLIRGIWLSFTEYNLLTSGVPPASTTSTSRLATRPRSC